MGESPRGSPREMQWMHLNLAHIRRRKPAARRIVTSIIRGNVMRTIPDGEAEAHYVGTSANVLEYVDGTVKEQAMRGIGIAASAGVTHRARERARRCESARPRTQGRAPSAKEGTTSMVRSPSRIRGSLASDMR